jgi:hypothetical protein
MSNSSSPVAGSRSAAQMSIAQMARHLAAKVNGGSGQVTLPPLAPRGTVEHLGGDEYVRVTWPWAPKSGDPYASRIAG